MAASDEDPRTCLYFSALIEVLFRDQSPARALWSLLTMFWFWPSGAEEKNLFLGSVLLCFGRLLREKLACLALDMATCLSCHRDVKADKQAVTTS